MVKDANIFVIQHKITIHIKCIHSIHFLSIYVYSPILYVYKYIFLKIIIILLWLLCSFAKWEVKKIKAFKEVICLNSQGCDKTQELESGSVSSNLISFIYHLIAVLNWVKTVFIHFQQKQGSTAPLVFVISSKILRVKHWFL